MEVAAVIDVNAVIPVAVYGVGVKGVRNRSAYNTRRQVAIIAIISRADRRIIANTGIGVEVVIVNINADVAVFAYGLGGFHCARECVRYGRRVNRSQNIAGYA